MIYGYFILLLLSKYQFLITHT